MTNTNKHTAYPAPCHGMGDCLNWGDNRNRSHKYIHSEVTVWLRSEIHAHWDDGHNRAQCSPRWGNGHSRAQGSVHAGVTVVAAPSGIISTESSILLQHSVPHEFGEAKGERYLDKVSATSIRTAEVTICIISERLLDRPRRLPNTKKRHSKVKLTLLKPSQAKVHSQPRWVVAVPSGRRTSFVGSDVHNPTTSTGT